jgi:hypothetical protein
VDDNDIDKGLWSMVLARVRVHARNMAEFLKGKDLILNPQASIIKLFSLATRRVSAGEPS